MNTYCSLPWIHLASHPDGGVTLCCISDHKNGESRSKNLNPIKFLNLNQNSVVEVMNSDYFKQVRIDMLEGKIPNACRRCFQEESAGIRSKRIEENKKFGFTEDMARAITQNDGSIPINFKFLELRLGNLCNLRCRTCNPNSSTQWIEPYQKLQKELEFVTFYEKKIDCSWIENEEFWEDLLSHSEDLKLIYINGGEPTLVEKHWKYLERLVERGLNNKITLWYNINMTHLPDKLIELWKQFKKVQISCSIDDLGTRNDYIRSGSRWDQVIANLDKLQSLGWCEVSVCQTVSWINVYYINEFNKFMKNRGLHVHLNFVHDPDFMSVRALPVKIKNIILEKCVDLNPNDLNHLQSQFKDDDDLDLFKKGLEYNNFLDKTNKKNFPDYFQDWYNVLKTV
jgi:MoaA/NifB/PqqE/SkfB family radical SAM enzyme